MKGISTREFREKQGMYQQDKHRLVYKIEEEKITVLVLSAYGHYDDK